MEGLLSTVSSCLSVLYGASSSHGMRQGAEHELDALSSVASKYAAQALRVPAVMADAGLYWYFIASLEKDIERMYWSSDSNAKNMLQQVWHWPSSLS